MPAGGDMQGRWLAAGMVGIALAYTAAGAMTDEEHALVEGRRAASELSDTLRGKLVESLKSGGPVEAMKVCSYQAQVIVREVFDRERVEVRRTSLKVRNPKNAPDAYERRILERMEEQARQGELPREVFEAAEAGGKKVYRYARPITVGPPCLTCHGSPQEIPEEVRVLLKERYPADRATGYKAGDFRGIVSATVPAG